MSTNSFKIKNSAVLTPKDLSTLVSPEAGEIACDINDSNKIKRYDAASASWVEVGSGGVGSVDIMFVQDFESASLSSFTQTGLSLSTTNPLHGKVSAVLTHQAAVNQSFKQIIPVDPKFRGQAMVLDLNVKSAASAGNVVIKVRDESNSADLIVSEALQLSNDVSGRRSSVSFTIPSTCSSLSYTITALPEAGSPVTRIDDIVAMLSDVSLLETSVLVPNLTAWQGYTPTFQGFGTPSNVEFEWRQVGESVEIRGKFTAGITTAVEARVGLPAGLTSASTSLIPSLQTCGIMGYNTGTAASFYSLIEPNVSYLTIGRQTSATGGLTKVNGNLFTSSTDVFSFFASVPCAGLSATSTKTIPLTQSGLVQEGDSALKAAGNAGQVITAAVTDIPFIATTMAGNAMSWSGSALTVLEAGIFDIDCRVAFTTTASRAVDLYINGVQISRIGAFISDNNHDGVITREFAQGDIISFRVAANAGTLSNSTYTHFLNVTKQGSLKQVSVSSDQKITIPTSELRFEGASSRGTGTETGIVQFTSLAKLRGDAFEISNSNGTAITMKKAGKLEVTASVYSSVANISYFVTKNQASRTGIPAAASEIIASGLSITTNSAGTGGSIDVKVGDIIRVSSTVNPTAIAASNFLNLSFQEQDISVSVTNTLPQFSESDSSVRVDTANGYGSTGTKIRRFSNVRDNIGTDIAYLDSATDGATFTVKSAGVYNISYSDNFNADSSLGITKNASSLSANIDVIPTAERLAMSTTNSANYSRTVSWQGYLQAGDIIRAHTNGATTGISDRSQFTISKVGKPNVTGVDVTPFVNVPQPDTQFLSATGGSGANAIVSNFSGLSSTNNGIISQTASRLTALKRCNFSLFVRATSGGAGNRIDIYKNGSLYVTGITIGSGSMLNQVSLLANIGDYFEVYSLGSGGNTGISYEANAEALSDQILTAPESFSTDTASLSYASSSLYNLTTLANAPVGTYITFTYAANTNTRTQTTTRPTQTDADMNTNGMQIYTRALNAVSTAAQPAAFAIQIGKGLKGRSIDLYAAAGKVLSGNLDFFYAAGGTNAVVGAYIKDYDEKTGILVIDAGFTPIASNTAHTLSFSDITSGTSGYLVINASKNPALTGIGLNRIAASYQTSAAASIASGSPSIVNFGTAVFDTNNAVTTGGSWKFTAPQAGYYQISSAISFTIPASTRYQLQLILRKNAVDYESSLISATQNSTNGTAGVSGSFLVYLNTGDYINMVISQDSGAARSMSASAYLNFINIAKVSV